MRAEGNTISGGPRYSEDIPLDLPREKRETPEQVRERMEAKLERRRQLSPWNRPSASKSGARVMGDQLVNKDYVADRFTSPPPADDPDDVVDATPAEETPVTTPKRYACPHCRATFATAQGLGGHKRVHRKPQPPRTVAPVEPEAAAPVAIDAGDHDGHTIVVGDPDDQGRCTELVGESLCVLDHGHDGDHVDPEQYIARDADGRRLRALMHVKEQQPPAPEPDPQPSTTTPADPDAPAAGDDAMCETRGRGSHKGLVCSKPRGHNGDHVAHDGDDHIAGRWTDTQALAATLTEVQSAALADPPTREDDARDLADVEELLGALEQYIEELPRGVTRTVVLGDVVTTLQMGTAALRGRYRELFGAEMAL